MTRTQLVAQLEESYDLKELELVLADGFEDACLGVVQSFTTLKVLYDYEACIQILITRDHIPEDDAREFFEYNTLGAFVGEGTPAFLMMKVEPPVAKPGRVAAGAVQGRRG